MKLKSLSKMLLLMAVLLMVYKAAGQHGKRELHIKKAPAAIQLDGVLDEPAWASAELADNFQQVWPYDTSAANLQTKTRMTFDDHFLYVGIEVQQARNTYIIASYKRDFEGGTSDVVSVNIDPFNDHLNGFNFGVNPYNVQREGLIAAGTDISFTWDNKWYSQVKNYPDHWVIEMAIPFKTLRYKVHQGQNVWGMNVGRFYMKTNEVSTWNPVPRNFKPFNLAYAGHLIWDDAPPHPGKNVSLIPYMAAGLSTTYPRAEEDLSRQPTQQTFNRGVGLDAKVAVTPSLNLDLTVNPDFSQVEVDKQQTNLSRFELFFPERRQFFIENSDLFGSFGFPESRPFFSRRIGLTRNQVTGLVQQVPILAGARLSGRINKDWRVGAMSMQTQKVGSGSQTQLPSTNFSVMALQRRLLERSAISGFFINKQDIGQPRSFNRVAGLEFNYFSNDNRWEAETFVHKSISPEKKTDELSVAQYVGYHHPNIDLNIGVERIGQNFRADMGYVPRTGVVNIYRPMKLILYPNNKQIAKYINTYGIGMEGKDTYSLTGKRLDSETPVFLYANSPDGMEIGVGYYFGFTHLFSPFEATNASDNPNPDFYRGLVPLPVGDYYYQAPFINFQTSQRHPFWGAIDIWRGDYYNGKGMGIEGSLAYRLQPYGTITVDVNYNDLQLPKPYNSARYWLVGPRAELAFSKAVFFSTFFQYNTQTNNTNINTRLQWRFKPVSDLFIVYTNNSFAQAIPAYGVQAWAPRSQAVMMKLTYWFNM